VVDLDLEKFFDRVNHDKLIAAIARRVTDKRVLRLIGAFLKVGVLENGLVSPAEEGTPARWSTLSTSIEHRTRRTRSRARTA